MTATQVRAGQITSGAASDGDVLTADGAGVAAWEAGGAGHAAVTLDADAAAILDLSTQEIGLDTQTANTVLAGPTTGAANEPTFRALVAADVGTGTPTGGKYLRDDMSWVTPAGAGDVVGPGGATDGNLAVFDGATGKLLKDGGAPGAGATDILMVQVFF